MYCGCQPGPTRVALHPGRVVKEPERQPYIRWTRGFDLPTHMLVISSSMGMFNGIQRATSDLRPATPFHLVLVKLAPAFKTCLSVVIQTRSDRLCARAPPEQLSSSVPRRYLLSQLEHAQSQLFLLPEFRRDVWELSTLLMTLVC